MIKYMVGNLWSNSYLNKIHATNLFRPNDWPHVREMYGSHQSSINPIGSARPDYRLPQMEEDEIAHYIQTTHSAKLEINYTLNTPCIGPMKDLDTQKMVTFLQKLEQWGVDRVTVSHPVIMELVQEHTQLPMEISTIQHVNSVAHLKFYEKYRVDKICLDIYRNRDIAFIRQFTKAARSVGIETELMVNEFCSVHGAPCEGIYRRACYNAHAHGGNPTDRDVPMLKRCIMGTPHTVADWLKSRFILPSDIRRYYEETGVEHFKISGRTLPEPQILAIIKAYMYETDIGELTDLWAVMHDKPLPHIPLQKLQRFLNRWFKQPDFHCSEHCGIDCTYCDDVAKMLVQK